MTNCAIARRCSFACKKRWVRIDEPSSRVRAAGPHPLVRAQQLHLFWKMKVWLLFNSEMWGGSQNMGMFVSVAFQSWTTTVSQKVVRLQQLGEFPPRFANLGEPRLVHAHIKRDTAQQTALDSLPPPAQFIVAMLNWRAIRFLLMTDSPLQNIAGDSEGDTPLAHARYFNAPDLYKLYSGNGATIAGPFYARLLGAYWGPFRTCAAHVLLLFFQSFLCGFANRGGKTPVNALFMLCVWCTICEQINDTKGQ